MTQLLLLLAVAFVISCILVGVGTWVCVATGLLPLSPKKIIARTDLTMLQLHLDTMSKDSVIEIEIAKVLTDAINEISTLRRSRREPTADDFTAAMLNLQVGIKDYVDKAERRLLKLESFQDYIKNVVDVSATQTIRRR